MAQDNKGKRQMRDLGQGKTPRQPVTIADAPAGGTGAAAGGWDTAANRNIAITSLNKVIAVLRSIGLAN